MNSFGYYSNIINSLRWPRAGRFFAWIFGRRFDEAVAARQRLILNTATDLLRFDDSDSILHNVVYNLVPEFGDWCYINLSLPNGEMLRFSEARSMTREQSEALDDVRRRFPPLPQAKIGLAYAIRTGKGQLIHDPDVLFDKEECASQERRDHWKRVGVVSFIVMPIKVRGKIYGGLGISSTTRGRYHSQSDFHSVQELAGLLGLALERTALIEEVRAANRQRDDFLAMLSHELRSPLAAILGWTHLLKQRWDAPEFNAIRAIDNIEQSAKAQKSLIDDMLDVSLVTMGQMQIHKEKLNLTDLLDGLVESKLPEAQGRGLAISFCFDNPSAIVMGDGGRLRQVFANLLNNAINFSDNGAAIDVIVKSRNEGFEVSICDQGAGIASDFLPHVFDRFRRGRQECSEPQRGLGLGLALVKHFVDLHGGNVQAFSAGPGKGACFTVYLPALPS